MTTAYRPTLSYGSEIKGKWNRNSYRVERKLGEGANGVVFLVQRNNQRYALKMGFDTVDLQSEVNALSLLSGYSGPFLGFLFETDDCLINNRTLPFYVMKYVEGRQLGDYLAAEGTEWLSVIGLKLLDQLCGLHGSGLIFCDLKAENVMVSGYGNVHLVDFGGLTQKGRSIKQFTEIYDRGYWNAGSRTADDSYDLFAFAVLCLRLLGAGNDCFNQGVLPQNRGKELLLKAVDESIPCQPYATCLQKALTGRYASSKEAYEDWKNVVYRSRAHITKGQGGLSGWFMTGIAVSLILFSSVIYLYISDLL
ncbi:MAG: serine/threonine protein kinase [Gorillibacterium sp.]|nr:serine/threonine protein kinase [Gorillibacterium sp.]